MHYSIHAGISAILLLIASPARAEESPKATTEAAKALASWFSEFLKPFAEIGATAERQHFIDTLVDLNRDLFDLEQEKRYVIVALKRQPLNVGELKKTAAKLAEKIKSLDATLRRTAPQLRVAYRKHGDEAVTLLAEALATRAAFVFSLENVQKSEIAQQIAESEAAVKALSAAQTSLADAISYLQLEN